MLPKRTNVPRRGRKVTKVDAGRWRRAVAGEFVRAACYIGRIRVLCRRNLMFRSVAVAPKILRLPFVALLLPLLVSGCGVNNIPTFQEQAKARWSDVQNQYQRRADLIPNLVETVRGYARQEREVLEAVTNARARAPRSRSRRRCSTTRKRSNASR